MNYLFVFLGGGMGSVLRFALSLWLMKPGVLFPRATLLANILAAAVVAVFYFLNAKSFSGTTWIFVVTGFCGGLSTFSTFSLETFDLFRSGHIYYAWLNILLSVGLGLIVFLLIQKFWPVA